MPTPAPLSRGYPSRRVVPPPGGGYRTLQSRKLALQVISTGEPSRMVTGPCWVGGAPAENETIKV